MRHLRGSVRRMNTGVNLGYTETCLKNKAELNRERKLTRSGSQTSRFEGKVGEKAYRQ